MDISARKSVEDQLAALNQTLEQRVEQRSAEARWQAAQLRALTSELTHTEQRERRRLAQILHDNLQQILVGAKFGLSILERASSREDILRALEQVNGLIDQSIDTSRSLAVELSPPILFDGGLPKALHWLADRMREKNGLEVAVEADEQADPVEEDLRVILFRGAQELLLNVAKHARVSAAEMRLRRSGSGRLQLTVRDKGVGFDKKRADGSSSSEGFGLFNIRERLELLGGCFELTSGPGRGTCVTLECPLQPPTDHDWAQQPEEVSPEEASADGSLMDHEGAIRVLLADDHDIVRSGLAGLLQMHKDIRIVGEATDGREAVELARRLRPDVIVMDVSMPRMNGVEATRQIVSELPETRILGLSMHKDGDMADAMRAAGAIDYITKSANPEELLAVIRRNAKEPAVSAPPHSPKDPPTGNDSEQQDRHGDDAADG